MLKNLSKFGIKITKEEQKQIQGGRIPKPSPCCDPTFSCCVPNNYYNGSNCRFVPGDPNAFPVPYCI